MSQMCSKMAIFLFQPILAAIFVTMATIKLESIPDFYTCATVVISLKEETSQSNFHIFAS